MDDVQRTSTDETPTRPGGFGRRALMFAAGTTALLTLTGCPGGAQDDDDDGDDGDDDD